MPQPAPQTLDARLHEAVASAGERVLVVGDETWATRARESGARVTRCDAAELLDARAAPEERFDLAIVGGVLEHLDHERGAALIARLRDLHARRLLVAVPARRDPDRHVSEWGLEQMLAHGLEARGTVIGHDTRYALYGFDIDRYKRTPDWLNSRNWANPEMWNRYRW